MQAMQPQPTSMHHHHHSICANSAMSMAPAMSAAMSASAAGDLFSQATSRLTGMAAGSAGSAADSFSQWSAYRSLISPAAAVLQVISCTTMKCFNHFSIKARCPIL